MKSKQKKRNAFTLLEIIIVILVIGIVLGITVVQIDSVMPVSRLKKQSRTTADLLELAFSMAAIEGRELSISFKPEERQILLEYYIDEDSDENFLLDQLNLDSDDEELEELKPLSIQEWDETLSLESIEIYTQDIDEDPRDFIIFSPEGMCDGAKIVWREKSGIKQELELWPLLGKISIKAVDHSEVH